jgi:hypothetical protein
MWLPQFYKEMCVWIFICTLSASTVEYRSDEAAMRTQDASECRMLETAMNLLGNVLIMHGTSVNWYVSHEVGSKDMSIEWEDNKYIIRLRKFGIIKRRIFKGFRKFLLCSPAQLLKVSFAGFLSKAWYKNTALPQCMLCINRLTASCWFACLQPLYKHCNGIQSCSEMRVWNKP